MPTRDPRRDADELAELLRATAGELARRTDRLRSTAVPAEQADLAHALLRLHRWLPTFVARIIPGAVRPGEWAALATHLQSLATRCHRQDDDPDIVIEGGTP